MRVLVDTNIILDFLLQRELFFQDADLLFQAINGGQVVGYVTATTLTDIFYIAIEQGLDAILTRDAKGFLNSSILCYQYRSYCNDWDVKKIIYFGRHRCQLHCQIVANAVQHCAGAGRNAIF